MVAVALLDGQVMPEQYQPECIVRRDVQELLRQVIVRPSAELSQRFPAEMPCCLTVHLRGGRVLHKEKSDYEGFRDRPMNWSTVRQKFERLGRTHASRSLFEDIEAAVENLDSTQVRGLTELLAKVKVMD